MTTTHAGRTPALVILACCLATAGCTGYNRASPPVNSPSPGNNSGQNQAAPAGPAGCAGSATSLSGLLGTFDNAIPGGRQAGPTLRWEKAAGFDVTINYLPFAARSRDDIQAYLDEAQALGMRVILSLNDYYPGQNDEYPGLAAREAKLLGSKDPQQQALTAVRLFANHPAVWGFSITDVVPKGPSQLDGWTAAFVKRCQLIKQLTPKPLIAKVMGWTSADPEVRRDFAKAMKAGADFLLLDNRPYPHGNSAGPLANIPQVAQELKAVAGNNGGFVIQTLGWDGYPAPTTDQIVEMARLALANGAVHIFIHLVDRAQWQLDPERQRAVAAAAPRIRPLLHKE